MSNRAHRRPGRAQPDRDLLALVLAAMRAAARCSCHPDLTVRHHDGIAHHTMHHDDDCPAIDHSSQLAIVPRRKARR